MQYTKGNTILVMIFFAISEDESSVKSSDDIEVFVEVVDDILNTKDFGITMSKNLTQGFYFSMSLTTLI
jgi:hypothetical protein